jgi:hypothetical protein
MTLPLLHTNAENDGRVFRNDHALEPGVAVSYAIDGSGAVIGFPLNVNDFLMAGIALPGGQVFCQFGGIARVRMVVNPEAEQVFLKGSLLGPLTELTNPLPVGAPLPGSWTSQAQATTMFGANAEVRLCGILQEDLTIPAGLGLNDNVYALIQWMPIFTEMQSGLDTGPL